MTFDYEYGEYQLLHGDSSPAQNTGAQQATEYLATTAAELGTGAAQLLESIGHALDEESHGAFSTSLQETVTGINTSASALRHSQTEQEVREQTEYIQQAGQHGETVTGQLEEAFGQLPEQTRQEHAHVPEQIGRASCRERV